MACDLPAEHNHQLNFVLGALFEFPINNGEAGHIFALHHSQLFGNKFYTPVDNFSQTHVDLTRLKTSKFTSLFF